MKKNLKIQIWKSIITDLCIKKYYLQVYFSISHRSEDVKHDITSCNRPDFNSCLFHQAKPINNIASSN